MRSAAQLSRTTREHAAAKRAESSQALNELREIFDKAKTERPPWYTWVLDGCPRLTEAEYEAAGGVHARRRAQPA